ncbi:MAG: hypothetical protein ICV60_09185 [Pyrinomonadaceae bacterium]|nr:hypothetical protein [Pyrinomonadaceae bacterium]
MQKLSLKSLICLSALMACALFILACQPAQQPSNGNAAGANSNAANASQASAPSGYIDLVGKWEGQSAGQPSTLIISSHMGDTFSGMKTVGEYQIAIAGVVDLKTREIIIRETDVKKGPSGYPLGVGNGVIAPNGRQMSGEWKAKGSASTFSFSK